MKLYTQSNDGKLPGAHAEILREAIKELSGKSIVIEVKQYRKAKNKYQGYWRAAILPAVIKHFLDNGDPIDQDEAHRFMIEDVAKWTKDYINIMGEEKKRPVSSSDFTDDDWIQLINIAKAWMAQWGVPFVERDYRV